MVATTDDVAGDAGGRSADKLPVAEALAQMQALVQQGKIAEARDLGAAAAVPLSIAASELSLGKQLSEGAESVVYEGVFRGQPVAVKKLRLSTSADLDRFRSELKLLAQLNHPNVVTLVGAKALPPDYMVVLQLQQSNLQHMLYEQAWRPSWDVILRLGIAAADAVSAVHALGMVHRDLKPANLLMGADGQVRLSDFGIALPVAQAAHTVEEANHKAFQRGRVGRPTGGFHKARMMGTLQYMAPEVLLKEPTSPASDVYAFGVTLNELATGIIPFSDCTKDNPEVHTVLEMGYGQQELATAVAAEGLRPLLPRAHPPGYEELLAACWKRKPADRPSMAQVREALQQIAASLPAWQQSQVKAGALSASNGPSIVITAEALSPEDSGCLTLNASHAQGGGSGVEGAAAPGCWLLRGPTTDDGYVPTVSAGFFEAIGPRDTMEDRHIVLPAWHPDTAAGAAQTQSQAMEVDGGAAAATQPTPMTLLGVFDGHRGPQAADYCRQHLPHVLAECSKASANPQQALKDTFLRLDAGYRRLWEADCASRAQTGKAGGQYPGCTAMAALLVGNDLYVANAGDCRAVLSRGPTGVLALSRDHTAALEDERQRVQAQGGSVSWSHGGWRLGNCGLQVSRCIGDFDYKGHGLTAEPEVTHTRLTPTDGVLVLGSDGLWDCISNEEAVGLVRDTVKDPSLCAKRLVMEALARGSQDNVTALVAFLCPVSTLEQVYADGKQAFGATATVYGSRRRAGPDMAAGASADELRETY